MNALNSLLQLTLVVAVVFYFGGFIAPQPLKFRLWKWSVLLVLVVFLIALVVLEARTHPFASFMLFVCASLLSFAILEIRHRLAHPIHRSPTTPFLSLRTTGKTAAEVDDEHPFAAHDGEDEK